MSIFKLLLIPASISLLSIASPVIYAAGATDVEQCTEQKRKAYPGDTLFNQRQRCMPIAATCWGGEAVQMQYMNIVVPKL